MKRKIVNFKVVFCLLFMVMCCINPLQSKAENNEEAYVYQTEGYFNFYEYADRIEISSLETERIEKDRIVVLEVPEMIHGKPVTKFDIFSEEYLTKVIFPKYMQEVRYRIGEEGALSVYAFEVVEDNPYLYSEDGIVYTRAENALMACPVAKRDPIVIPEGVTKICEEAFYENRAEEVILPESVREIEKYAFARSELKKIVLPDGVRRIEAYAFYDCMDLEDLELPKNLRYIGEAAFLDTGILGNIEIPKNVSVLSKKVFSGTGVEKVTFAKGSVLKTIEAEAFSYCGWLSGIEFPSGLKKIGAEAFVYCNHLRKIKLPYSVKKIAKTAFVKKGKRKRLTIQAKKGSYAYKYAKKMKKQRVKAVAI